MIEGTEPHELDSFQKDVESSEALTIWAYNFLIQNQKLSRPVGPPTLVERRKKVTSSFTAVRLRTSGDVWLENELIAISKRIDTVSLTDADISWINKLDDSQLFVVWYYLRTAMLIYDQQSRLDTTLATMSKRIEESPKTITPVYEFYGLPTTPTTKKEMLSCALDFIFYWNAPVDVKRQDLKMMYYKVSQIDVAHDFKFAQNTSQQELHDLWRYLRDRKDMIGRHCEAMSQFGLSRIVGVFNVWSLTQQERSDALKSAELYLRDKRSKQKSKKERVNLTLSAHARLKLIELAGGERKVSTYIEKLILSQES